MCLQVVTYRCITIASPDPLRQGSASTSMSRGSGAARGLATASGRSNASGSGHGGSGQGHSGGGHSGNSGGSDGGQEGGGLATLSARAVAFAAATAAAQDDAARRASEDVGRERQRGPSPPPEQGSGGRQRQPQGQHSGDGGGGEPLPPPPPPPGQRQRQRGGGGGADGEFGRFGRTISVRVDPEAAIDEEELLAGDAEVLAETWMLMEFCDRCAQGLQWSCRCIACILRCGIVQKGGRRPAPADHLVSRADPGAGPGMALSCCEHRQSLVGSQQETLLRRGSLEKAFHHGFFKQKAGDGVDMVSCPAAESPSCTLQKGTVYHTAAMPAS